MKVTTKYPARAKPKDNVKDEEGDMERYCFCREPGWMGGDFVDCAKNDCNITWYHLECVDLESSPEEDWICPRCKGENNWCICGKESKYHFCVIFVNIEESISLCPFKNFWHSRLFSSQFLSQTKYIAPRTQFPLVFNIFLQNVKKTPK